MSANLERHLSLLGLRVRDKVTNFEGVVSHVGFDLYGCIQAIVTPPVQEKNELKETRWFDIGRLQVIDEMPVIEQPDFDWSAKSLSAGLKGPSEKPRAEKN